MSIYSFSDIELQAYKNIWIAIQNYDVHAELPAIDSEKVLTLYKKVLSESKSGTCTIKIKYVCVVAFGAAELNLRCVMSSKTGGLR